MSNVVRLSEVYRTPEEYLAAEELSDTKHEYLNGMIYAMAGASRAHNQIARNLLRHLENRLAGQTCEPLGSDMRLVIRQPGATFYYYPDVTVDCSGSKDNVVENPTVIFEILSPQSDRADLGDKLVNYQRIRALQAYVIVDQVRPSVRVYRRDNDETWKLEFIGDPAGTLQLPEISCSLTMVEIYERVFS